MQRINFSNVASHVLKKLTALQVDAGEFSFSQSSGFSVSARLGDVETVEHQAEKNFSITVFQNQCTGSASSADFSLDALSATIEKAATIARFSSPDPYAGLADKNCLAKNYPNCDLYHPWDISSKDAIALAIACEKKALSIDKRIVNSEGVTVTTLNSRAAYANTLGFFGEFAVSEHGIQCSLIARDKNGMQRDDEYSVARNPAALRPMEEIAQRAAEKTVRRLNPQRIKTQVCPVIFEASVARSLLRAFVQAISGGNLYRQTSFLLNALGKPIFPAFIQVYQQPHLLSAMGSSPFDRDGVATVDQFYVRDGELVNYVLGSYSARKLGLKTTGNAGGVFNLSISHTDVTLQQLIQKMHRGLLVTELMGQGVNITTGDYSRGAAGFWVEGGEIQFPVEGITIAGNLKALFAGLVAVSGDTDDRGAIRTGSMLFDQITVGSETIL